MRISGFTVVKNAVRYDFPVVESISSMLPLCDEVVVNVGLPDDDGTLELVQGIEDPKIKVITQQWDPTLRVGGRILAVQTNMALYHCTGDWCLYLQADEVLHEDDHATIRSSTEENLEDPRVQGLLFDFLHFFGDYRTVIRSYHWYRREIRIVRNHIGISSWRDAQGFRLDGKKLRVRESGGRVFHYGWVRRDDVMEAKKIYQDSLHHGQEPKDDEGGFRMEGHLDPHLLGDFAGTHPGVMDRRVREWTYRFDRLKRTHPLTLSDLRCRATDILARMTGVRVGEYRNYRLLRK